MPRPLYPRRTSIILLMVGVGVVIAVFRGYPFAWVTDTTSGLFAPLVRGITGARTFLSLILNGGDLARRVSELEGQNRDLRAAIVQQEDLRLQMQFYRDTAALREQVPGELVEARIFAYTRSGGVKQVILNRGSGDGVALGDVVITAHQEFVGVVDQLFVRHAVVRTLGDATLEVTARVANSDIAGLIRSDRDGRLTLDLIQKDELLTEGALVVTSGDDRYPAGLLIGTIRSIDREAVTLFQVVRINSILDSHIHGRVLVVRL